MNIPHKIYKAFFLFMACSIVQREVAAQVNLDPYNIVWTTQSKNSSESMPCGGGDIGMNVWVENGQVLIYVAKNGNFDENNALMKTGRLRLRFQPGDLLNGEGFKQELHVKEGYVTVEGANNGIKTTIRIWADVSKPVVHIDINSSKKISVLASYESWRYQDRVIQQRENFANSWKWAAPKNNVYKGDEIIFDSNRVLFYHHNAGKTIFDSTVAQQGLESVKDQLYNPLKHLTWGGSLSGNNFVIGQLYGGDYVNTDYRGWTLQSKSPARVQNLQLCLYNEQVENVNTWQRSLVALEVVAALDTRAFERTQKWWKEFWSRSYVVIDEKKPGEKSWEVGRNYQLFRYMLALNAHGEWPTKFNGGLLTVDPVFTDEGNKLTPDYRNWGGGLQTAQNQRLVYFPMIKSGDWDLLQPELNFYMRILKNAELRSKVYWGHDGACFTEQMDNYGLPDFAEYGQNRPDNFDKGVEYNAWLEYLWDTVLEFCKMMLDEQQYTGQDISDKIPFIESCLRFFDEHYQYLAKKRGIKTFDGEGKLVLFPGAGAETFKMANNSTSTIAALQTITQRLLALPSNYLDATKRKHWEGFLKRIPPLNYRSFDGHITLSPAKTWERVQNEESTQLYPVFPWHIYGIGKPGLDTAVNTWNYDTSVIKFRSYRGWKQDNIWAADLGLSDEAWKLTSMKLANSPRRFPAFWGPGFDWVPDHNWGGSGMIGLQEMLLQTDDMRILLFPAWPKDKDVHFKLHAPYNTTVEAQLRNGKIESLIVVPEERKKDVEIMLK